jgi:hypothetical protein
VVDEIGTQVEQGVMGWCRTSRQRSGRPRVLVIWQAVRQAVHVACRAACALITALDIHSHHALPGIMPTS